jgi:hypothetical protein
MICYVATHGARNVVLLQRLLAPEMQQANGDIRLVPTSEHNGVTSRGASIATVNRRPVAMCYDALSVDPGQIAEDRLTIEEDLMYGVPRSLWKLFIAVPELQSLLFADRAILEALVGGPVAEAQLIRGHYEPKVVLAGLLKERGISDEEFDRRLAQADLTPLRQLAPIRELVEFVAKHAFAPAA